MSDIQKQRFHTLIDLSLGDEYAFLAKYVWRIHNRIGYRYKKRGRHLNRTVPLTGDFSDQHVVSHHYQLLKYLHIQPEAFEKKLYFHHHPEALRWLAHLFGTRGISEKEKIISLLPGGGASWGRQASAKYWPLHYYVTLANRLISVYRVKIILLGGTEDRGICEKIEANLDATMINLAGKTTLYQTAAALEASSLVIGTESGPLHLATALGRPSIAIFGPASSVSYGPYAPDQKQIALYTDIPCHPCYRNFRMPVCSHQLCLKELSPERVFEAASLFLKIE